MAAVGGSAPVPAQGVPPFEINLQRVRNAGAEKCARAGTYIVPTLYLHAETRNRTSAQDKFTRARVRIYTQGLEKAGLQRLAKTLYDDLVARLRATGATVLTYDDVRAEMTTFSRKAPNPKYDLPTWSDRNSTMDFLVAAPSDEQTVDWGMTGITFPYRAMVKAHNAAVIIPEITFTLPQVGASARNIESFGWLSREANITVDPAMKLYNAMMNGMPANQGWCSFQVQEHGVRLAAESVGTARKIGEDRFQTGTGIYAGTDDWNVLRTDYAFDIDRKAFDTGVLRVGYALNGLIVSTLKGK